MSRLNFIFVTISLLLITGCNAVSFTRDRTIAETFVIGANKDSVERKLGNPKSVTATPDGKNFCYDYDHNLPNGKQTPLYVDFRKIDNKVVEYGLLTCQEAAKKGFLNKDEPLKQVY